ncbi:recombinase family protein [Nocardia brasiliensis]|uniref:recombinase family protein n=1 Tax=Nocardia brasiliensis TaxID=37326 RepID=UPI0024589CCD|nr:recombinase family protein [Nocardia brasiliensis]
MTDGGQLIGYLNRSQVPQDLRLQVAGLNGVGVSRIFSDGAGGQNERPQLRACLEYVCTGDTVVVWTWEHLGANIIEVFKLVRKLADRGVGFQSISDGVDTKRPMDMVSIATAFTSAQLGREVASGRTRGELGSARRNEAKVLNVSAILGCSHAAVYNFMSPN